MQPMQVQVLAASPTDKKKEMWARYYKALLKCCRLYLLYALA